MKTNYITPKIAVIEVDVVYLYAQSQGGNPGGGNSAGGSDTGGSEGDGDFSSRTSLSNNIWDGQNDMW